MMQVAQNTLNSLAVVKCTYHILQDATLPSTTR